jgi:hypothetical protein
VALLTVSCAAYEPAAAGVKVIAPMLQLAPLASCRPDVQFPAGTVKPAEPDSAKGAALRVTGPFTAVIETEEQMRVDPTSTPPQLTDAELTLSVPGFTEGPAPLTGTSTL